jgi:hypothetical protein
MNIKALQLKALREERVIAVDWLTLSVREGERHEIADQNGNLVAFFAVPPQLNGTCRIRSAKLKSGSLLVALGTTWRVERYWANAGELTVGVVVEIVAAPARD